VALLALAVLEYAYQRWQYMQDLRMTKLEVRDELRLMEGDPLSRERRRRVQRQIASERMMHDLPRADAVVTGSMETAVAVRYASSMAAPVIVAKGKGMVARRILEFAEERDIPVVERRPLAHALFRGCSVGEPIPAEFYQDVAEVLAFVYELNRMKTGRRPVVA